MLFNATIVKKEEECVQPHAPKALPGDLPTPLQTPTLPGRGEHRPVPSPNAPSPYQRRPVRIRPFAPRDSRPRWEGFFNTFLMKSRELC